MCVLFAYITKKIPDLVSSFLNGSPALSGGGMISQATSMASKAATVAGAGVGSMAGAAGGAAKTLSTMKDANGPIGKMSTLGKAGAQFVGGTAWNMAKTGMGAALTSNPIAGGFAKGVKMAVGSDGTMANASFARKVQDLAGLTNQAGEPILGKAMGKNYKPESSKSDGEDKEKEKNTGGGKTEDADRQKPIIPNPNANPSEGKKTTINSVVNNMNQQVANTQDNKNHNYNMNGPQAQNNQTGGTKTDGVVGSAKTDGTVQQAGINQQTKNTNNQQIQNIQKGDNGGGGTPSDGAISRMKK